MIFADVGGMLFQRPIRFQMRLPHRVVRGWGKMIFAYFFDFFSDNFFPGVELR
jgi:hypothetical protein